MDPTTGPFSWLTKLLSMQGQGGSQFGALGGGLNGSAPSPALPAMASGGMPMSGIGPGAPGAPAPSAAPLPAPLNLNPQNQQPNNPNVGLWNTAQQLLKPQQIQTPGWMPWIQR